MSSESISFVKFEFEGMKTSHRDAIRRRPSMYIGSTDQRGLHILILELVNNAIDEWLARRCRRITVKLHRDGACSVSDDGPGIPVDPFPQFGLRFVELAFSNEFTRVPKKSGDYVDSGLRGFGLKVVNALSAQVEVLVAREGEFWSRQYRQGLPCGPLECLGDIQKTGTTVTFWPDPEIFRDARSFDGETLEGRLRELACLHPGLELILVDSRQSKERWQVFRFPGGAADYLKWLNRTRNPIHTVLQFHHEVADEKRGFRSLDIAIQWTRHPNESLCAFVNSWPVERGPHIRGFHRGVTHAIRRFGAAREIGADRALGLDEVCAGLTGIIALRIPEPQFLGSTRTHLGNQDVQGFVQRPVRLLLLNYLQTHPNEANVILEWIASRRPGASGCVQ